MNKNKKLEELERRQREIADDIKRLRDTEKHVPRAGDVYHDPACSDGPYLLLGDEAHVALGSYRLATATIPDHEGFSNDIYLGKFSDVFITKKEVAQTIAGVKDEDGDNLFSNDGLLPAASKDLARALAELGITEGLSEEE